MVTSPIYRTRSIISLALLNISQVLHVTHVQLEGNYSAACRICGKTIKICILQNVFPYKLKFRVCRSALLGFSLGLRLDGRGLTY